MTKKLVIGVLLAFPLLMNAQHSTQHSGQHSRMQGTANQGQFGRIAGVNPAYNQRTFSNFYGSGYNNGASSFYYGPSNGTILGPGFNSSPGFSAGAPSNIVTFVPELAPPVQGPYIPTYMRPDDGPSLAEVAKSLRTERKPAVLIWSNWESPATKN